jgi:hypothetical protein
MALIAVMAVLGSALTVTSALTTSVLERRSEIGLLKAMGAGSPRVVGLFVCEAVMVGALGGLIGRLGGALLARVISASVFGAPVAIRPLSVPLAVAAALLITCAGCIVPVRRILSFRPWRSCVGSEPRGAGVAGVRVRAGGPRWRTAVRFLIRSLSLRGPTFLLALLAITVGATLSATMLGIRIDLAAKMSKELRRFGPNLIVVPRAGWDCAAPFARADAAASARRDARPSRTRAARPLPRVTSAPDSSTSGVVSPLLLAHGRRGAAPIAGACTAPPRLRPLPDSGGRALRDRHRRGSRRAPPARSSWRVEGVVARRRREPPASSAPRSRRAPALAPGATALVAVRGPGGRAQRPSREAATGPARRLIVAGIVSTGESEDDAVIVPLALLQEETGLAGRVSLVALSVDGGSEAVAKAASAVPRRASGRRRAAAATGRRVPGRRPGQARPDDVPAHARRDGPLGALPRHDAHDERRRAPRARSASCARSAPAISEIVSMFVGEVLLLGIAGRPDRNGPGGPVRVGHRHAAVRDADRAARPDRPARAGDQLVLCLDARCSCRCAARWRSRPAAALRGD